MTRTILLVDDSEVIQLTLSALLEDHGHDLVVAGSLAEARAFDDRVFDAALVDLNLPDGLGTHLLAELRARRPQTVRVLMTGDEKAVAPDADLVLGKGRDPGEIGALLDRMIDERRGGRGE